MGIENCTAVECDKLFESRRSIRFYTDQIVSKDMIEHLLGLAATAPSVMNIQPWRFTVVQGDKREGILGSMRQSCKYIDEAVGLLEPEDKQALQSDSHTSKEKIMEFYETLGRASAIIAVTMKKVDNKALRRQMLVSCGAAVQNLMLAANCYGLGTCCVGFALWVEEKILQDLGSLDSELVTIIALGYPAEHPNPATQKKVTIDWIGP